MKLTLDQIKAIAKGVVCVDEENGAVHFHRFNKKQEELYQARSADCYKKSYATSGVRLEFSTNSPTLLMEVEVASGSSRKYFSHDIYINGELASSFGSQATTK